MSRVAAAASGSATGSVIGVKVRRQSGGGEVPFLTLAMDESGNWNPTDPSIHNDGASFVIRQTKQWEPIASAACAGAIATCPDCVFIDSRAHIGWYCSIAAQCGARDVCLVEDNSVYLNIASKNVELGGASTVHRFSTVSDAVAFADTRPCILRLHGLHSDKSVLSFVRISSFTSLFAAIIDMHPGDFEDSIRAHDFLFSVLSVFHVFSIGTPEQSSVCQSLEDNIRIVHEHNLREFISTWKSSGQTLVFVRKNESASAIITEIASRIDSAHRRAHI